jgi:chromosome segregation ATPase
VSGARHNQQPIGENDVNNKELYQQKVEAQLDEWKAEVDRLRAKAAGASADRQLEMNRQIEDLEGRIEDGQAKLAELADTSEDAWESIKDGFESAWDSLRAAFDDAASKFRG